jgi:RNA polymerase sigma factor (TIGR02999 family)
MSSATQEVTRALRDMSGGSEDAPARLMPLVYDELRRLAQTYLATERPDHTLQATALVHEAYLKLVEQTSVTWHNRAHFFAVAAQAMRRILVDHARARRAAKRGSGQKLSLDEAVSFPQQTDVDVIALDEALTQLAEFDEMQSRIVEMRFFSGLTIAETAHALRVSPATVKREWTVAKAWLHRRMSAGG